MDHPEHAFRHALRVTSAWHNEVVEPTGERPKGILVVDDEPAILALISSILAANGYTVLAAPSSMAALEQSRGREANIALLLTDIVMPDLNGPHLADQLLARIPTLRVLFMSGWEPQVIAHEGAFRRGFRTLVKPLSAAGLLEAIDTVLQEPVPVAKSGALYP